MAKLQPDRVRPNQTTNHYQHSRCSRIDTNLVQKKKLVSIFGFENEELLFPNVHHAFKFAILTIGVPNSAQAAEYAFYARQTAVLSDCARRYRLGPDDLARINPNTSNAPLFRSQADAALTAGIYNRVPVLVRAEGDGDRNPWGIQFVRMFDMANDSGLFRTAEQLAALGLVRQGADWVDPPGVAPLQAGLLLAGGRDRTSLPLDGEARTGRRFVPLYEAKMVHQYDHRWATYDGTDSRDTTQAEHENPAWEPTPRYWLPAPDVAAALPPGRRDRRWLMGWRDIARATDERTLIAGVIPSVGCNDKFLLILPDQPPRLCAALYGSLNSLACDYIARQKLGGTSFKYFTMRQIAVLPPSAYSPSALSFIVPRVLELTYTSHSLAPFARDLGHAGPPFAWDEGRRATLRAELDAWYARAYGLTRDELRYVLDPADTHGPTYPSETFRVLRENETRRHREYRTRRLVLEAWDQLDDSSR